MKLSFVFLLLTLTQVNAKVLAQKASIHLKNVPITQVFQELRKQTNYDFLYSTETIKQVGPISVNVTNASIEDILKACFEGQPITYSIDNSTVLIRKRNLLKLKEKPAEIIQEDVVGDVVDESNQPIPGVTIKVKGTTKGGTTNGEGKFAIQVPPNSVLTFSVIGYMAQEIAVAGQKTLHVVLKEDEQTLGEVVVTALGISKEKKSLSYAVTEVGGESFTKARENNLGNALTGKIAGVNATPSATGPAGSSRVIIRGNGSFSGNNQPLYVVNGVPITNALQSQPGTYGGMDKGDGLNSINPDDIESISVLKGGTAAALYGSRASNGVILITTKSGKAQQGIGVEYASTFTLERPLSLPDWQYEYGSGTRGNKPTTRAEAVANGRISWGAKLDGAMVIQPDGNEHPYVAQRDNVKNFYNNGTTFSNTLSLVGGNEGINFRLSAADMKNKGIVPNSDIDRKTFNLSVNSNLKNKILFEGRVQYGIEKVNNRSYIAEFVKNPNANVQLLATNIDVRTLAPGYDENGYEMMWSDDMYNTNPYFAITKAHNEDERRRLIGSFSTRYNFTDYLYARARLGIDHINVRAEDITPTGIAYNVFGSMETNRNTAYETNSEAILGFDKAVGKFSVNLIAGVNRMYSNYYNMYLTSGNFNVPFQYFITNGINQNFQETFQESSINSVFASGDIGFSNYLYGTFTVRKDWFSTLAKANNSITYPSFGLSYVFSESMHSRPSWLTFGKLRGSWAQVGGGAPTPYGLDLTYTAQSQSHLGQPLMGITGTTVPNEALRPYTSTTYEFGTELGFLDNRVSLDLTFYNRKTTNDIVSASIPRSSGYENVSLNVGEIENRGIEVLLSGKPVKSTNGFSWDVSYNFAYNQNTVNKIADGITTLSIPGASPRTLNAFIYHYQGMPFGMIAGYQALRNDAGEIVYNKDNGLPMQSAIMALGRGVPPLTMGLTNTFSYKNLSLSFLLDAKFGNKMYVSSNAYGTYYGLDKRTVANNVREDGITVSGVDMDGQPYSQTLSAQTYYQGTALSITDDYISDAGFIKLRQLTLDYQLPAKWVSKLSMQSARLSFVARNLWLIYSQVKNVDPESNYSSSNAQGLENFGVPPTRSFGLNLLVKF